VLVSTEDFAIVSLLDKSMLHFFFGMPLISEVRRKFLVPRHRSSVCQGVEICISDAEILLFNLSTFMCVHMGKIFPRRLTPKPFALARNGLGTHGLLLWKSSWASCVVGESFFVYI
jgi:hypothetical protein